MTLTAPMGCSVCGAGERDCHREGRFCCPWRAVPRAQLSFPVQQPQARAKGTHHLSVLLTFPLETFIISVFIRLQVHDGHSAGREGQSSEAELFLWDMTPILSLLSWPGTPFQCHNDNSSEHL